MCHDLTVLMNKRGGLYGIGRLYTKAKWMEIVRRYEDEVTMNITCTVRWLVVIACTSTKSVAKKITYPQSGLIVRYFKRGHQRNRAGTICGWVATHDAMTWDLYLENPSRPLTGYVEELERMSGLAVSTMKICCWFQTIDPFKATMWEKSPFSCRQDSWSTYHHLCQYLDFILSIDNHWRLVFADEKLMKEVMIYYKVWRNCTMGQTSHPRMEANSKNRYSILATVTIKGERVSHVYTDLSIFLFWWRFYLKKESCLRGIFW